MSLGIIVGGIYRRITGPATAPHGLDGMLSDREKLIRLPSSPSTTSARYLFATSELDLFSQHTMFSRFASAARRAGRHARQLSTAAAGDGSGFLIAGGVGVAAIACMAPRADEGHAAAPAIPADEASKKLLAVLSHGEELAKIAKVKATMPDNIARSQKASGCGATSHDDALRAR